MTSGNAARNCNRGFSLIELLIVVAISGFERGQSNSSQFFGDRLRQPAAESAYAGCSR